MALFDLNPALLYSLLAVLPPGAIFFVAYGRYDGAFRDNVVFLYFMGGILMGFLLGFLTILALTSTVLPLLLVLLLALIYPIALTVGINRRKWQGERHAVFNGGALGIGVALMVGFTLLYVLYVVNVPEGEPVLTAAKAAQAVLLVSGMTGVFFGLGLLAGNAVRTRKPFMSALAGTATAVAPVVLLIEYVASREWLWLALLVVYGVVYAVAAERRLLIEGVSEEARKERRRRRRAKMS